MEEEKIIPVRLEIRGRQMDDGGNVQETDAVFDAVCREEDGGADGRRHLFYFLMEDGEASLSLTVRSACLERKNGTRMVFDPALPSTDCSYVTPFGVIPMRIRTERVAVLGRGDSLKARIRYRLFQGDGAGMDCTVTVSSSPRRRA